MTTERQQAANQRNAQHSSGPTTAAGKATVAQNPLRHGLQSRSVRMSWESEVDFNAFVSDARDYFKPVGFLEEMLVDNIIAAQWRLARLAQMEVGVFYFSVAEVARMKAAMPDGEAVEVNALFPLNSAELKMQPEAVLGSALSYDLTQGGCLTNIDRYRRSCEQTIADSLDRLSELPEARQEND